MGEESELWFASASRWVTLGHLLGRDTNGPGGTMTSRTALARAIAVAASSAILLGACAVGSGGANPERAAPGSTSPAPTQSTASPDATEPAVKSTEIVTVGDIACDPTSPVFDDPQYCRHEEVSKLTKRLVNQGAEWFLPLGDIQYEDGALDKFNTVYDKWFGQFMPITKPIPGNHEWNTEGAAGYFDYFGKRAGTAAEPWRSFSPVKGWRVFLLDSNCEFVGGCGPDSAQGKWLANELKQSKQDCSIAAWHHPLHTSGGYNGDEATIERAQPLWDLAEAGGVDVVLNGHDHIYERFAPIDGMTQFVVGSGGKEFYQLGDPAPKSKVRFDDRVGVLRMTLSSDATYDYAFIDARTDKVLDAGSQSCRNDRARG